MRDDVNECIGSILGDPVADVFHVMTIEDPHRVIPEPGIEVGELSVRCGVGSEFEDFVTLGLNIVWPKEGPSAETGQKD